MNERIRVSMTVSNYFETIEAETEKLNHNFSKVKKTGSSGIRNHQPFARVKLSGVSRRAPNQSWRWIAGIRQSAAAQPA